MQLSKSYKLLRFLNRRHSAASRYALAALGWTGALISTGEPILARALAAEFKTNNYELAFRKAARYARRLSRRFNVIADPFFNFTQNTTQQERDALLRSLQRSQKRLPPVDYLTDQLYILAANIHHQLEQDLQPDDDIARFYALANEALALTNNPADPHPATAPKPEQTPNFSHAQARQALQDLATVLPIAQWRWFIISGTFLGLHREGSFLAHDYDIDTGIHAEGLDIEHLLLTLQDSGSFIVKKLDHHVEVLRNNNQRSLRKRPSMIKLVHGNGMQVDIFIHYTENGKCWHGSVIHRWENTPFQLVPRQMEGVNVLTPSNADLYLTENYGGWRTPIKSYDCTTGTPNLVISANFLSYALFVKNYLHFSANSNHQSKNTPSLFQRNDLIEATSTGPQLSQAI